METSTSRIIFITFGLILLVEMAVCKDMMRKSIVFDKNTPDVFYCPIHKPTGFDKLIVKARSLKKLCEFEGQPLPEDYKSDCYQDVDESDYACKEKYRIMMRTNPPGSDKPYDGRRMVKFMNVDKEFYISKIDNKVKAKSLETGGNKRKSTGGRTQRRRNGSRKSSLRNRLIYQ